jgi:hypothetical protein
VTIVVIQESCKLWNVALGIGTHLISCEKTGNLMGLYLVDERQVVLGLNKRCVGECWELIETELRCMASSLEFHFPATFSYSFYLV